MAYASARILHYREVLLLPAKPCEELVELTLLLSAEGSSSSSLSESGEGERTSILIVTGYFKNVLRAFYPISNADFSASLDTGGFGRRDVTLYSVFLGAIVSCPRGLWKLWHTISQYKHYPSSNRSYRPKLIIVIYIKEVVCLLIYIWSKPAVLPGVIISCSRGLETLVYY